MNDAGREVLEQMYAQEGQLVPRHVWQAARDEDHPLHNEFNWNVQEAAEAHWEHRARELIRSVKIPVMSTPDDEVPAPTRSVRVWAAGQNLSSDRQNGSYYPTRDVIANPADREALIQSMLQEMASMRFRYRGLTEFIEIIDAAREEMTARAQ